jgi:hypothetical protein
LEFETHSAPEQGCGASIGVSHFVAIDTVQYGEKQDAATHDGVDFAGFFRAVIPGWSEGPDPE